MNQEIEENLPNAQEDKSSHIFQHLDKVFFTLALAYLGLGLYWINQPKLVEHPTKEIKQAVSNSQFLSYLQQSLKIIKETSLKPQNTPKAQKAIIEKVYIPLYTPKVPPLPTPGTTPAPGTNSKIKVVSIPVPPKPLPATLVPPPPLTVNPGDKTPAKVSSTQPNTTIDTTIELKGVLESGTNSEALFSFKGITKRLQPGEPISNSGWVFQGVSQQRAIISKGGETRYIEVGQKF